MNKPTSSSAILFQRLKLASIPLLAVVLLVALYWPKQTAPSSAVETAVSPAGAVHDSDSTSKQRAVLAGRSQSSWRASLDEALAVDPFKRPPAIAALFAEPATATASPAASPPSSASSSANIAAPLP